MSMNPFCENAMEEAIKLKVRANNTASLCFVALFNGCNSLLLGGYGDGVLMMAGSGHQWHRLSGSTFSASRDLGLCSYQGANTSTQRQLFADRLLPRGTRPPTRLVLCSSTLTRNKRLSPSWVQIMWFALGPYALTHGLIIVASLVSLLSVQWFSDIWLPIFRKHFPLLFGEFSPLSAGW